MEVAETSLVYSSSSDVFTFWHLTDIHMGSRYCSEGLLDEIVGKIKDDPKSYWWLGGDSCDFILYQDEKRFDPEGVASWISVADLANLPVCQVNRVAEKLRPIVDRCLGVSFGNHDDIIRRKYSQDVHMLLLGKMNGWRNQKMAPIPSLGYSAFHILRFHRMRVRKGHGAERTLTVFLHHGWFGGRLKGGKALNLERAFLYYNCDMAFFGHNHDRLALKTVMMEPMKKGNVWTFHAKTRVAVNSGGFLRGLAFPGEGTPYTERAGYYPTSLGPIPVTYNPEKQEITIIE